MAYVFASLLRHGSRSRSLVLGLAAVTTLFAAALFFADALRAEADRAIDLAPDLTVQRMHGGRPALIGAREAEPLSTIASVASVTPRVWGYLFLPRLNANATVVGVGRERTAVSVAGGTLESGRDLLAGSHEAVVGARLAELLSIAVGDKLPTGGESATPFTLRVVGTFHSRFSIYTSDLIVTDEADARALLGYADNEATDLAIALRNPDEANVVAATISESLGNARIVSRAAAAQTHAVVYGRRAGIFVALSLPALVVFLVLAIDRLGGLGASERREIAILKATGWSTSDVLRCKLVESAILGIAGASLGIASAYAWVFWMGAAGLRAAISGFSVLYPDGALTPQVDFAQLVSLAAAIVAPFVSISVLPAFRAASGDPMTAMRNR